MRNTKPTKRNVSSGIQPVRRPVNHRITFFTRWKKSKHSGFDDTYVSEWPAIKDGSMTLHGGRVKVIRRPIITIEFDYPLHDPVTFTFINLTGFTRRDLLRCIYRGYSKIYSDTWKYGVWGHGMGDLILNNITWAGPTRMQYELSLDS